MLPHVFALLLPLMAGGAAAANGNNNTNVAAARNSSAVWPSGMILSMTIWPDSEDTPPWNSRFNFPAKGHTSGAPRSDPYFAIAGTHLTNGTEDGFTVIWSVLLQETCREDDSNTESFSSGASTTHVRFDGMFRVHLADHTRAAPQELIGPLVSAAVSPNPRCLGLRLSDSRVHTRRPKLGQAKKVQISRLAFPVEIASYISGSSIWSCGDEIRLLGSQC
ncbi:hypothetical protein BDV35DRAFT_382517 [Aspergillus flavus]|uniref:DUF7136 domain-containing protein n=1 Tax=Aspergillus flavus TaxID=5059 RepID=A0A5N6GRM4_ASPFL|nr:hypothetical protein BDV35DRAFT_382517 [Aspergillus flavus]